VVAQRQGALAAHNMLGRKQRLAVVPFFWSQHYDLTLRYVGHAEHWDEVRVDGDLDARDARIDYLAAGNAWQWPPSTATRKALWRNWLSSANWRPRQRNREEAMGISQDGALAIDRRERNSLARRSLQFLDWQPSEPRARWEPWFRAGYAVFAIVFSLTVVVDAFAHETVMLGLGWSTKRATR